MIKNINDLLEYKHSKREWKTNAYNIPVTQFDLNEEGAHKFNEILKFVLSLNLKQIIRTQSGGISNYRLFNKYNCYDYRWTRTCAEITLLTLEGCWRFQCRTKVPENSKGKSLYGSTCLAEFKKICLEVSGIDLDDYAVDNGLEIKQQWKEKEKRIYKKQVFGQSLNLIDKTLTNVHHIDLCSGFQSGLVRAFPEFKDACQYLYDKRKQDESIKLIQVESIGAMWSDQRKAKYIRLAKGAIEENNRFLMEIVHKLLVNGRKPLLLNTDGVWYQGDVYHDETEYANLGGWKTDHTNCTFRMKNNVTYEFIENGEYNVVMSGLTTLDQIKPDRSKWQWGDIYNTNVIEYRIDSNGISTIEGDYF